MFRFRKGVVFAKNDFNTVCSWVQFPNDAAWKYDIMISKIFKNSKKIIIKVL